MKGQGVAVAAMKAKVLELMFQAIDEFSEQPGTPEIEKSPETPLFGPSSVLDSLQLVNIIVALEQKIEEEFGRAIGAIANERAMSQKSSPLRTIGTLADFVTSILVEELRKVRR